VLDDQFEPGYISPAGHSVPPRLEPSMIQCATASVVAFARAVGFTSEPLSPCPGHPDVLALEVLVSEGQAAHVRVDQWTILGRTLVRSTDSSAAAAFAEQIASGVASRVTLT
jgi:hypothetical protein